MSFRAQALDALLTEHQRREEAALEHYQRLARGECSIFKALAAALNSDFEDIFNLQQFIQQRNPALPLPYDGFVELMNAYLDTKRRRHTTASDLDEELNSMRLRLKGLTFSSAKWHVNYQRARSRVILYSDSKPDEGGEDDESLLRHHSLLYQHQHQHHYPSFHSSRSSRSASQRSEIPSSDIQSTPLSSPFAGMGSARSGEGSSRYGSGRDAHGSGRDRRREYGKPPPGKTPRLTSACNTWTEDEDLPAGSAQPPQAFEADAVADVEVAEEEREVNAAPVGGDSFGTTSTSLAAHVDGAPPPARPFKAVETVEPPWAGQWQDGARFNRTSGMRAGCGDPKWSPAGCGEQRCTSLPACLVGATSCHGIDYNGEKINQDCACIGHPLGGDSSVGLFMVVDGHGAHGHEVADFVMNRMYDRLNSIDWRSAEADGVVDAQLGSSFDAIDASLHALRTDEAQGALQGSCNGSGNGSYNGNCNGGSLEEGRQQSLALQSGACAVVLLLSGHRVSLAHVGDCRAVVGQRNARGDMEAVQLTDDHVPTSPLERSRLEAAGAYLQPAQLEPYYEPCRVCFSSESPRPGLTISRCFGDLEARSIGVISHPTISHLEVRDEKDCFLIIASGGLWEFISSSTAAEIVNGFHQRGEPAPMAAKFLVAKASLEWRLQEGSYRDDITCIVVYLCPECLPMLTASRGTEML